MIMTELGAEPVNRIRYSQYVIVISVSTVSGFSFEFFLPIPAAADGLLPGPSPVLPTQEQGLPIAGCKSSSRVMQRLGTG